MGASWVRKNILEKYPDAPLRVYSVWVPQVGATRGDVDPTLYGDDRVTSYWDQDGLVGEAVRGEVPTPFEFVVYDVYALYDRTARWENRSTRVTDSGAPVIADSGRLGGRVADLLEGT